MINTATQIQKCLELKQDLYVVFLHLIKAFDAVNHDSLWKILHKVGCPEKFESLVRTVYERMIARVQKCGESSDPFPVSNGTKDGCVLAPSLYSLVFSVMWTVVSTYSLVQMESCSI